MTKQTSEIEGDKAETDVMKIRGLLSRLIVTYRDTDRSSERTNPLTIEQATAKLNTMLVEGKIEARIDELNECKSRCMTCDGKGYVETGGMAMEDDLVEKEPCDDCWWIDGRINTLKAQLEDKLGDSQDG